MGRRKEEQEKQQAECYKKITSKMSRKKEKTKCEENHRKGKKIKINSITSLYKPVCVCSGGHPADSWDLWWGAEED